MLANTLQIGKRHPDVIKIKQHLNRLGLTSFKNPNDYFGKQTEAGIKKLQAQYGLPVTGIADKRTIHTLENAFIKIFIDPGHGGHDPGALGYGLREKDIVLDIARELEKELNKYAGVEVKLSRTSDRFISLSERTKMANDWGAHYFVSLHLNAGGGRGFESYIYNGSVSQETRNRQKDIHNHLANWLSSNNGIRDRGMKRANFHVLRESNMPAILLEYMFIDNRTENNLLKNKNYCKTLGKVTAEAIAKSFGLKKK